MSLGANTSGVVRDDIPMAPMAMGTRVRLWLLYNLYMFVVLASAVALVALAFFVPWWLALLMGVGALLLGQFAWSIVSKHPRKLRATGRAMTRIERGIFEPDQVVRYCGDPCSRLVAHEILRRAGYYWRERLRLVKDGKTKAQDADRQLVLVDRARGQLVTVNGATTETTSLRAEKEEAHEFNECKDAKSDGGRGVVGGRGNTA